MKSIKYTRISFLMILSIFLLVGCQSEDKQSNQIKKSNTSEYPITIVDGTNEKVSIQEKPNKIVSVMPSSTEIIYALGEGNRVIGVSDFDNYPEEVLEKEKYGSLELNMEKIIASGADTLILSVYHKNTYQEALELCKAAGITVIAIDDASTLNATYKAIEDFGRILGVQQKAADTVSEMKTQVKEIKEKSNSLAVTDKKSVWVEISPSPDIYTAGKGTFIDEMLTLIGATNIAEGIEGWGKFSDEEVVAADPDIIITTYGSYQKEPELQVLSRKGWANITAVRNKAVYDLDNDMLSRPSPRLIMGLNQLAETIYPEIYK